MLTFKDRVEIFQEKMERWNYLTFDRINKDFYEELDTHYVIPQRILEKIVDNAFIVEDYREVLEDSLCISFEWIEEIINEFLDTGNLTEAIKKRNPNYEDIIIEEERMLWRTTYSLSQEVSVLEDKLAQFLSRNNRDIIDRYESIEKINYLERIDFLKRNIEIFKNKKEFSILETIWVLALIRFFFWK